MARQKEFDDQLLIPRTRKSVRNLQGVGCYQLWVVGSTWPPM